MRSYTSVRPNTTIILFAPSFTRQLQNPRFGLGVAKPNRERRAPFSLADLDAYRDLYACPSTAYTEAEYRDHLESTTFSREEYADHLAHLRSAELDRYIECEAAEWDEFGIDPAKMDELAEEARQLDATCGFQFGPIDAPAPTVTRKSRPRYATLHTRHRAARLAGKVVAR